MKCKNHDSDYWIITKGSIEFHALSFMSVYASPKISNDKACFELELFIHESLNKDAVINILTSFMELLSKKLREIATDNRWKVEP